MTEKLWADDYKKKLINPDQLAVWSEKRKNEGKTIATLNGSFDLMHAGHLEMIYQASQQADILLLALNSDASIKRYKSIDRPIIPLEYRLRMMAALEFVDFITWFEEDDPRSLLEQIQPHVHVNGSEYGENCLEADVVKKHGGKIKIIALVPGLSTSEIIKKVKSCAS